MPARGYSSTPSRDRGESKGKDKLREQVAEARRKARAGKGLKADSGDVTKGTKPMATAADTSRALRVAGSPIGTLRTPEQRQTERNRQSVRSASDALPSDASIKRFPRLKSFTKVQENIIKSTHERNRAKYETLPAEDRRAYQLADGLLRREEILRDAAEYREQTGLTGLPKDYRSAIPQARAQRQYEHDNPVDDPVRLGLRIALEAKDDGPEEIERAARAVQAGGFSADAVRKALDNLPKKEESFAIKVLQQFSRVSSAMAGGVRATYKGDNPVVGAAKGLVKNDQSFSDVLADAGAPEWAQTAGGLALDIALDPTTYLTLGATAPAKVAAKGAQVAALKAGARADEALEVARKVYDAHPLKGRGVQVGLRGTPVRAASTAKHAVKTGSVRKGYGLSTREVKTSGRASSKVLGTPAKTAASSVRALPGASKMLAAADRVGIELVNSYRPRGIHPVDFDHIRSTARQYRAARGAGERAAVGRLKGYQKFAKANAIGAKGLERIAYALDGGNLDALKGAERDLADFLKRDLSGIATREVGAGVRSADAVVENYWPRVMRAIADKDLGVLGSSGRSVTGSSFKARKDRRAFEDMTPEQAARYITDDLEPVARRLGDSGRALAMAKLHEEMAALGPVVKSLDEVDEVGGSLRTVYVREAKGFKRLWNDVDGPEQIRKNVEAALKSGREVRAIPEQTFELAFEQAHRGRQSLDDGMIGRGFDITQGRLKTLQTVVNPGYHMTNLLGDLFNARAGGARFSEIKGAVRQVRLERKLDNFSADVAQSIESLNAHALTTGGRTERYGDNGLLPDAVIVDLAREHGAIQTGFAGSELHALNKTKATKSYRLDQRFLEGARHANELREDVARLVSFRSALKRNMTPEEAAAHVTRYHFDYSDLTDAERRFARRAIPFYTFARHNIPLQAAGLVTSPGRYATVEKTRDASADASGLDEDFASGLPSYMQRQVPFAIPGLSASGLPIAANLKLPLNDLNALDPRSWPDEFAQRMTVLAKMPTEQYAKYDFFFKDEIRKDFVPAPSWAADPQIKQIIEDTTGTKVKMIHDRKTGKMVPGWSWRVDKIMRLLPVTGALANVTTPGKSRHAKGTLAAVGYGLGARPFALDPVEAKTALLFDELEDLESEQAALKQTVKHRSGEKWGGKIKQLGARIRKIQDEIASLDEQGGYDAPRFGKAKRRAHSGYGLGGSIGGRYSRPGIYDGSIGGRYGP